MNKRIDIKNLVMTLRLAAISTMGWGQVDSIILIDENFNIPIFETAEYNAVPESGWNYELFGPNLQDGTPCLRISGSGYLVWPSLNVEGVDSLKILFNHKGNCCGNSAYRKLQLSVDSITWWDYELLPMSGNWILDEVSVNWLLEGIDTLFFRFYFYSNTPAYIDNVKIIGYLSEPIIEEPLICDTVYIEQPPIIIYETDVPQECMLDGNGDGVIGLNDLLNLLQWYGNLSPCTVYSQSPPQTKSGLIDIPYHDPTHNKKVLKILDTSGREVSPNTKGFLLYIYEDGTIEKRLVI